MKTTENLFRRFGYDDEKVKERLGEIFETMFYGTGERIYHPVGEDMGYIEDTGNHDVRTEGMSYGMMVCVQMGRKEEFDRIWKWAKTYMQLKDGAYRGYFAWSCRTDGTHNAEGPAPDGEEYFAMALFLASARFGDGEGIFNYSEEARKILWECIHKGQDGRPGAAMWNPENHLIRFVPELDMTDPSYHLPHFYAYFAEHAFWDDRPFFAEAARKSRSYLHAACSPKTGLSPEYSTFAGEPFTGLQEIYGRHDWYYSDAYRTMANIAVDCSWNHADPWQVKIAQKFQEFFCKRKDDWDAVWTIKGERVRNEDGSFMKALHPIAIAAVNAEASLAALGEAHPSSQAADNAAYCIRRFYETPLRTGVRRYYDNFLYFFSFLALSGRYCRF